MKTRSKIYNVEINFDEASKAWRLNKKKLVNGCFSYICGKILENGKCCRNQSKFGEPCSNHKN